LCGVGFVSPLGDKKLLIEGWMLGSQSEACFEGENCMLWLLPMFHVAEELEMLLETAASNIQVIQ